MSPVQKKKNIVSEDNLHVSSCGHSAISRWLRPSQWEYYSTLLRQWWKEKDLRVFNKDTLFPSGFPVCSWLQVQHALMPIAVKHSPIRPVQVLMELGGTVMSMCPFCFSYFRGSLQANRTTRTKQGCAKVLCEQSLKDAGMASIEGWCVLSRFLSSSCGTLRGRGKSEEAKKCSC